MKRKPLENLLWSIALPGFGQLLNHKYFKGLLLIALEFFINMGSNLNTIIILSFQGEMAEAIQQTDYQWLMFYPCVYMFGIWDAFKDAGGNKSPYTFLPFVLSAFLGTVGIIYSSSVTFYGRLIGPVWFALLLAFFGIAIGLTLKRRLEKQAH